MDMTPLQVSCWRCKFLRQAQSGTPSTINLYTMEQSALRTWVLEYCCAIWDPHLAKDRDNLEAVQRRAARFVTQDYSRDTSVTQLLKDLHWLQLKDLSLMYRIVTGKVVVPVGDILLPADSRTRSKHEHKYRHFNSTCEQYRHSFFCTNCPWVEPATWGLH